MKQQQAKYTRHLSAIVCRMRAEEAVDVSDAEIARTLGACVSGGALIALATHLRDTGWLTDRDVT